MKRHILAAFLLLAIPALASLPPFLFSPSAKEIKAFGSGYSISLDNGQHLSVDRFGMGYRITAGDREVSVYNQTGDGWVQASGGRTWILGKDGKWRTGNGDAIVSRVISDIVLQQGGTTIKWRQEGSTWTRLPQEAPR